MVNESNRGEDLFPVPFIARSLSSVLPSLSPAGGGGGGGGTPTWKGWGCLSSHLGSSGQNAIILSCNRWATPRLVSFWGCNSKFPMSIPAHFIWESPSTGSVQSWTAFRLSSQLGRVFLTACYLNGPRALMSQAEEVWWNLIQKMATPRMRFTLGDCCDYHTIKTIPLSLLSSSY